MTSDQRWLQGTRAAQFPRAPRLALMGLVALYIATLLACGAFLLVHNLVIVPGELLLLISLMVLTVFVYTATRNRASGLGRQTAH